MPTSSALNCISYIERPCCIYSGYMALGLPWEFVLYFPLISKRILFNQINIFLKLKSCHHKSTRVFIIRRRMSSCWLIPFWVYVAFFLCFEIPLLFLLWHHHAMHCGLFPQAKSAELWTCEKCAGVAETVNHSPQTLSFSDFTVGQPWALVVLVRAHIKVCDCVRWGIGTRPKTASIKEMKSCAI